MYSKKSFYLIALFSLVNILKIDRSAFIIINKVPDHYREPYIITPKYMCYDLRLILLAPLVFISPTTGLPL